MFDYIFAEIDDDVVPVTEILDDLSDSVTWGDANHTLIGWPILRKALSATLYRHADTLRLPQDVSSTAVASTIDNVLDGVRAKYREIMIDPDTLLIDMES